MTGTTRRDLFKLGAATAAGLIATRLGAVESNGPVALKPLPAVPFNPATAAAMPTRNLGRTGHHVGLFSLGGQAAIEKPENEKVAIPLIERALDLGVNYLDTSARYGGDARWSEQYFGRVMKHRRHEVFLATKTHDRTADGSLRILETSLELLQTDHVDLWQLHAMSSMDDVERVCAKGGALEAFQKARDQKLVRFLGLSGHTDPEVLAEAIRRFPFDCLLMAFNAADTWHLPFQKTLLPLAVGKEMGIIGMKIPARGRILEGFQPPPADKQRGPVKADPHHERGHALHSDLPREHRHHRRGHYRAAGRERCHRPRLLAIQRQPAQSARTEGEAGVRAGLVVQARCTAESKIGVTCERPGIAKPPPTARPDCGNRPRHLPLLPAGPAFFASARLGSDPGGPVHAVSPVA